MFLLASLSAVAQVPSSVQVIKADSHRQTGATSTGYAEGLFFVSVEFPTQLFDTSVVRLRKPNGTFVTLVHPYGIRRAYLEALFPTSAERNEAYPNGTYQIVVTGGGADTTLSLPVNFTPIPPPAVTNFDELQSIVGPTAQINWTPISKVGNESEELAWAQAIEDGILFYSQLIPDPRQTSFAVQDLYSELPMTGSLRYLRHQVSTANGGATTVTVSTGVTLLFPLHRTATRPAAPAAFGGFASGDGTVTLSWQIPASGDNPTSYRFERSTSPAFPPSSTYVGVFNGSQTSFIDRSAFSPVPTIYYYRLTGITSTGSSPPSAVAEVQTSRVLGKGATRLMNIATRARCGVGANVTIGGFVVSGTEPKRVLIRAVGPTLATQGISSEEVLKDPTLALYAGQTIIGSNDNWGTNSNAADIVTVGAQVGAAPLATGDTASAALLVDLAPGVYSFIVNGKNASEGVVLLEVYDANPSNDSRFTNIATRANSMSGAGVTIGGFVITGEAPKQVLLRAIGPSLVDQGIAGHEVLADPVIEVHRGAPIIATNDNWRTNELYAGISVQGSRIGAAPIAESDSKSAALLLRLPPGVYSFLAHDRNNASGIVLVEVYDAD